MLLVGFGSLFFLRGEAGDIRTPRPWHWGAGAISLALILGAFLRNHTLALEQGVPVDFPELWYFAGVVVGVAAGLDLIRGQAADRGQPTGAGSGA